MGAGKDTLADYFVREHGFVKYSLAAPMKKLLNDRFGWTSADWDDREWKERQFDACGSPRRTGMIAPDSFSPRSWAQWLGTDVGRYIGGPDCWVNMMVREWVELNDVNEETFGQLPRMIVPDVRFDNEARRIHALSGVIVRVIRTDLPPPPPHVSERGISDELVDIQVAVGGGECGLLVMRAERALLNYPRGA